MTEQWSNFMVASASAAAALTGLLFVAVSLRPGVIRASPIMLGRARSAFYCFVAVIIAALADLAPTSSVLVGAAQLVPPLVLAAATVRFTRAARRAGQLRGHYPRVVAYYSGLLALAAAGALRATGSHSGDDQVVLATATVALICVGLNNSWALVISHGTETGS